MTNDIELGTVEIGKQIMTIITGHKEKVETDP